jgi:hypothetical protein
MTLWRIEPLLGNDLETETTAVAMQRRGKTHLYNNIFTAETVFSTRSVPMSYLEDNCGDQVS